jgi:hypothetical protein
LSHKMWLIVRNIFEVDTLRNEKVILKNILLHQNFNLKSGQDADTGASRTALHIVELTKQIQKYSDQL